MPWITLTEADVRTRLAGPELAALKTAALATDQVDPLPEVVEQVVAEVRGYVAACGRNTLGPDDTLPAELKGAALNRIRFELASRLPVQSLMTDSRKAANAAAVALLQRVASCQFALVQPETANANQPSGTPVAIVSSTPRRATRDSLNGL